MIYADVTAGCLLPLQTGIPRTTRNLHRLLQTHRGDEYQPVVWQPFRGAYTSLSTRAEKLLNDPFANRFGRKAPRDSTLPLLRASFADLLRFPKTVPLPRLLREGDTLLLASIFPDNRLSYLQKLLHGPGRKTAIFHDAIPLRDPGLPSWERRRHLASLHLFAGFDLVIAVSEAARAELVALWNENGIATRAATCVLPWPVPFIGERPSENALTHGPKSILYVSRLKRVKNHASLLRACEKLWGERIDFTLELIGCEDDRRESAPVLTAIAQMRARGLAVRWRAQVSEEELHAAYRASAFTVFPSTAEGFGLPILESLWHGRPVICSPLGAMGELAHDGGCFTVDAENFKLLASAMRELLQDEEKLALLSREARARNFRSWDDYWRDLEPCLATP
jgi:glycosyltransferase involved in cell wall biosynthesis